MSNTVVPGLFKHLKTGKLYSVLGTARLVENPDKKMIVYLQNYTSVLRGTDEILPINSMWLREVEDFKEKFEQIKSRD